MQLHLVLPGLLWPAKVLYDCAHDLELPALSRLLGCGRVQWTQALPLEQWLCREFGIATGEAPVAGDRTATGDAPVAQDRLATEDAPVAPLRLLGEGIDPGDCVWLCADPIHLGFEQGRLTLGSQVLQLGEAEMQDLLQALAPRMAQIPGYLHLRAGAAGSGYAYLALAAKPLINTTPPSVARGMGGIVALPQGPQAAAWTRLGNELQMLLHAMPENRQREAAGLPVVNSLWFWGAGALPPPRQSAAYASILGADPLLKGLARWSGAAVVPQPESGRDLPPEGTSLVCLGELAAATQSLDASLWRKRMLALEHDWFAPIAAAHSSGRLKTLRLTALGSEATLELNLRGRDRFSFWRKPRSLASLAATGIRAAADD